jgi:hypothetical protein
MAWPNRESPPGLLMVCNSVCPRTIGIGENNNTASSNATTLRERLVNFSTRIAPFPGL